MHVPAILMQDKKHGLRENEAQELLELLRDCANAAPVMPVDQHKYPVKVSQDFLYQQAVTQLKSTQIWKRSEAVRNWLNTTWLSIPQVCMYARYLVAFVLLYLFDTVALGTSLP